MGVCGGGRRSETLMAMEDTFEGDLYADGDSAPDCEDL